MLRIVVLLVFAVALGAALGNYSSAFKKPVQEQFYLVESKEVPVVKTTAETIGVPLVEFPEGTTFKFGTMKHGTSRTHDFPIRNIGTAPLIIEKTGSTCKCTVGKLDKSVLQPGETEMIHLEWRGINVSSSFGQSATFKSNCLKYPEIKLQIEGAVIDSFVLKPSELNVGDFSSEVGVTREFSVFCFAEGVSLGGLSWSNPATEKFVKLDKTEFSPQEDQDNAAALKAFRIKLEVQPGAPVGLFGGSVMLHTDKGDDVDKLELKVSGRSVSNVSIIGGSFFDPEYNVIKFDTIKAAEGFNTKIWVVLRGEDHEKADVKLDLKPIDSLRIELGERKSEKNRTLVPIQLEIPKGAPEVNYPGTGKGAFYEFKLIVNSTKVVEIPLHIKLVVEK